MQNLWLEVWHSIGNINNENKDNNNLEKSIILNIFRKLSNISKTQNILLSQLNINSAGESGFKFK